MPIAASGSKLIAAQKSTLTAAKSAGARIYADDMEYEKCEGDEDEVDRDHIRVVGDLDFVHHEVRGMAGEHGCGGKLSNG